MTVSDITDWPPTLKVADVAKIMRVGRDKAYELARRADFPKIKSGNRILVPREAFWRWYNDVAPTIRELA